MSTVTWSRRRLYAVCEQDNTPVAGQTRPTAWPGWSLSCEIWAFPGNTGIQLWPFWDQAMNDPIKNHIFYASSFEANWKPAVYSGEPLHLSSPWTLTSARSAKCRSLSSYDKISKKTLDLNVLRLFRVWSRRSIQMSQGALTSSQAFVLSRKRLQTRLAFAILCVCPAALACSHARLAKSGSYGFPFQSSVVHQSTHGTSQCWAYVLDPHLNQRNSKFKKRQRNEVRNFWDCKWMFPAFLV